MPSQLRRSRSVILTGAGVLLTAAALELGGNVGNQTYDLPADFELGPRNRTVLVWCEAVTVEFVAAKVAVG